MSEVQNGKMGAVDFMNLIEDTFNTMLKLSDTKGAEYASDRQNQNRHENFDRAAVRMNLTPEQVLQVLLDKHITAIYTWISRVANPPKTEVVTSEPITGRIDDAILYLILLKGLYIRRLGVQENKERAKIERASAADGPKLKWSHFHDGSDC